jgi:hypothetical protein
MFKIDLLIAKSAFDFWIEKKTQQKVSRFGLSA